MLAANQELDPRDVGFPPGWVREKDFANPIAEANIAKEASDGKKANPKRNSASRPRMTLSSTGKLKTICTAI